MRVWERVSFRLPIPGFRKGGRVGNEEGRVVVRRWEGFCVYNFLTERVYILNFSPWCASHLTAGI